MSFYGTVVSQGTFTQPATAVNTTIQVPSNLDILEVWNYTQAAATGSGTSPCAVYSWWTRSNTAVPTGGLYLASTTSSQAVTVGATGAGAYQLYDPSVLTPTGPIAVTNINTSSGVVLTGTTTGLVVGSFVKLYGLVGQAVQELEGVEFAVTAVSASTSFTITMPSGVAAGGALTAGYYVHVYPGLFYPKVRTIVAASASGASTLITTSVPNTYAAGQQVRFNMPNISASVWGTTSLNGQQATITVVNSATQFTVNIPFSGTFAWPTAAQVPFTPPQVVPFGDDTPTAVAQSPALSSTEDSVYNSGYLGMVLTANVASSSNYVFPAGNASDVIYWKAIKSAYGGL